MIAAFLAVIGVALGAFLTYYFNRSQAQSQWMQDTATRAKERQRTAYAGYARAVKEDVRVSRKVAAYLGAAASHNSLPPKAPRC